MEPEKRRSLVLGILFGGIILFSIIYFFWGNLINRGTILLHAQAPFSVQVFYGPKFECTLSPCAIDLKTGETQLIISKEGYDTLLKTVDVELWQDIELNLEFPLKPQIQKITDFPLIEDESIEYKLVFDQEKGSQKLINANDEYQIPIVYFPQEIKLPKIFGNPKSILVIGQNGAYLVDAIKKTRERITKVDIQNGKWSENGDYFVFASAKSANLWLLERTGEIRKLQLNISLDQVFISQNDLFFATNQGFSNAGKPDPNLIDLLPEKDPEFVLFGSYSTLDDTYSKIIVSEDLKSLPQNIFVSGNHTELYFQSDEENFKIILRKI